MGLFVIKKGTSNKFSFNLKAANGSIIAVSQLYNDTQEAKKDISRLKKEISSATLEDQTIRGYSKASNPKFELYKDEKEEFRFRFIAKNGDNLLRSEGYTVKASCKNGIASVIKNSPDAAIIE